MKEDLLSIGIIGAGTIGGYLARAILRGEVKRARLAAVADIVPPCGALGEELRDHHVPVVSSFTDLLDYPVRLVIECANQEVLGQCARLFVSRGIDLMVMSVGALVHGTFLQDLAQEAERKGCRIYIPSGAIGGIDALRAAKSQGLEEVILTTRKPPASLGKVRGLDLEGLREPMVVYEGRAEEAVIRFPLNVNVAATLSLAGIGPEKTKVCVIADPAVNQNIHEIRAKGGFGSFEIRLSNRPSAENPKTSLLACLSALALLKGIREPVQIGS